MSAFGTSSNLNYLELTAAIPPILTNDRMSLHGQFKKLKTVVCPEAV
jgi:hypothetical protein